MLDTLDMHQKHLGDESSCTRRADSGLPKSSQTFDARESTVRSIQEALRSGNTTCRNVVQAFLARIEALNPAINAIICLNQNALVDADRVDDRISRGESLGLLFGVPILLKDNFDAAGMPTTAGSLACKDMRPVYDASTVSALRSADAIILGKTNLHEFALEGLTVSSLGGQTLNPYDLTRTPGGSSGGSGAAVAASLAVMATGTDTVNSLRSPASANSLYAVRPTKGLISRGGIVPVSSTQDATGMIGRSLYDVALALTVMTSIGRDPRDGDTTAIPEEVIGRSYTDALEWSSPGRLNRWRIGILDDFVDPLALPATQPVSQMMQRVEDLLHRQGATVLHVRDAETFDVAHLRANIDVQTYEIHDLLDAYLGSPNLQGDYPRSFAEIFDAGKREFLVIPAQYSYIRAAMENSTASPEYGARLQQISALTRSLHRVFKLQDLDALVYPQQRNLAVPVGSVNQYGRNGILAPLTGSPVLCIPAAFSLPTRTAPIGLPIGLEILGMPWTEPKLFQIANDLDKGLQARKPPITQELSEAASIAGDYASVPNIIPKGARSIDREAYPLNCF